MKKNKRKRMTAKAIELILCGKARMHVKFNLLERLQKKQRKKGRNMKAITILEPWASLIACGAKKIETRSWHTKHRGKIAIHAGKSDEHLELVFQEPFISALEPFLRINRQTNFISSERIDNNRGKVIAIADLVDCVEMLGTKLSPEELPVNCVLGNKMVITGNELTFGDYAPGRYAWILKNIQQIEPVAAKGRLGLWEWDGENHACIRNE